MVTVPLDFASLGSSYGILLTDAHFWSCFSNLHSMKVCLFSAIVFDHQGLFHPKWFYDFGASSSSLWSMSMDSGISWHEVPISFTVATRLGLPFPPAWHTVAQIPSSPSIKASGDASSQEQYSDYKNPHFSPEKQEQEGVCRDRQYFSVMLCMFLCVKEAICDSFCLFKEFFL